LLEVFIYVNQTSVAGTQSSSSSSSATTTSGPPSSNANPPAATSPGTTPTPSPLPLYPKVVKMEERRISSSSLAAAPYCVQYYVNDEGVALPAKDGNGQPIELHLTETEPTAVPILLIRNADHINVREHSGDLEERSDSTSACDCAWLVS
jgi:hypothetical protein